MKEAKISPLFKKGDKQDIWNYRPIAVLSVFSKILENFMYNRLLCFLKKFNILTDEQMGLGIINLLQLLVTLLLKKYNKL